MSGSGAIPKPPGLARRLLRWAVGGGEADIAESELAEAFAARYEREGVGRARRWYWRQVAGFALRAPAVRSTRARESTVAVWLADVARDVGWAVRGLRRRPSFSAAAVLTLALGIGANSAVFTLLSAHFFTPLPYQRPDEVVLIWETQRSTQDPSTASVGNYFTWREQTTSFADLAAFNLDNATLSDGDGAAERVAASVVAPHFFDVLGARPALGSTFDAESARDADGLVVVLGHELWTRRYGADPQIVGKDVRVDGRPNRVVGVMPPTFRQPERSLSWQRPQLWRPLLLDGQRDDFGSRYLRTVARLAPGVSVKRAQAEMEGMAQRMERAYPEQNEGRGILVRTLDDYLMGEARPTLLVLLAAGAAVFLLVCANVANLTLARGEERQREFALRAALGSGHARLLRQLLLEGMVLAAAGAALGAGLVWGSRGVLQGVQARFFSGLVDVRVDFRVVGFTAVCALLAGVLSSLPTARSALRADVRESLVRGGERAGRGRSAAAMRHLLVVGQVGLATALAAVAALLTRSFQELTNVDPGFDSAGVMTFTVQSPPDRADRDAVLAYFREVWDGVQSIPGVEGVGMISDMPFTSENRFTEPVVDGLGAAEGGAPRVEYHGVVREYFDVMRVPLLAGEPFEGSWDAHHPMPVLVNQEMSERLWPAGDVLGSTFRLSSRDTTAIVVVGVVGNELDDGFASSPEPIFYMPFGTRVSRQMAFVVRLAGDPAVVSAGVREAVARVDPDVPAGNLQMLDDLLAETVVRPRAASLIGSAFALLALLVAAAGIYGVLSYSVQSRTREIGVRAALGASRQQLVQMILGQSGRSLLLGLVLGWIGALLAGRAVSGILFGVKAWDPLSLLTASALLFVAGTAASWLPARRAVRVDPRDALRAE